MRISKKDLSETTYTFWKYVLFFFEMFFLMIGTIFLAVFGAYFMSDYKFSPTNVTASILSSILTMLIVTFYIIAYEVVDQHKKRFEPDEEDELAKELLDEYFETKFDWGSFAYDLIDLFNSSEGDYILKEDFWKVWKIYFKGEEHE